MRVLVALSLLVLALLLPATALAAAPTRDRVDLNDPSADVDEVDYGNPPNGARFTLRDVGPDRAFVKDGVAYVAVTGRSETGTGRSGVTVIDLGTGEIVHQAGTDIGVYYDDFCDELA